MQLDAEVGLDKFLEMLFKKLKLRDYIYRWFPSDAAEIWGGFDGLVAGSMVDTVARDKIMRSLDDAEIW